MNESKTNKKPAQDAAQKTAEEVAAEKNAAAAVNLSNPPTKTPPPIGHPLVGKETMEAYQQEQATAIGCDSKKTVSGFEYLLILIRAMVREGVIAEIDLPAAASMARGMKANNSALRQWLYERSAEKKISAIAENYLKM